VVFSNGTVKKYYKNRLVSPMIWEYSDQDAFKGDLAIMDLLSTNKWKRPVYMSSTVPSSQYKGLEKFFIQEGMAYRIVPVKTDESEQGEYGMIDPHVMYDNMMNKFKWGNAADPSVYLDENNRRMFGNFRRLFGNLGKALLQAGDTAKAVEVVKRGLEIVPSDKLPYDYFAIGIAEVLIRAGEKEEGEKITGSVLNYSKAYLDYAIRLRSDQRFGLEIPTGINMQSLLDIYNLSVNLKLDSLSTQTEQMINNYYGKLYPRK
jgi:tetratricopeptide (TPR) repeat protein